MVSFRGTSPTFLLLVDSKSCAENVCVREGLTSNGRCRNHFPTSGTRSIKKNTCGTPNAISHPQNQRVERKHPQMVAFYWVSPMILWNNVHWWLNVSPMDIDCFYHHHHQAEKKPVVIKRAESPHVQSEIEQLNNWIVSSRVDQKIPKGIF